MKVLVACEESQAVCKAFREKGHEAYSCDIIECSGGHPEWHIQGDVLPLLNGDCEFVSADGQAHKIKGKWDMIIAFPPCTRLCTTYSVAAISRHRRREPNGNLTPITDYAKRCDEINKHLIELIQELKPKYWFIENPRGGFRKMDFMKPFPRYTVTYCKYGEKRMKPTDIWTNHPQPNFIPPCKNGDTCHEAAPRGARTGTQSLKNRIEKARIPALLCEHIARICEE